MANTSQYPIYVNGTRLDTFAHNIEKRDGISFMPGLRGSSEEIPGKHGSLYIPGKKRNPGRLILQMWADGVDDDGDGPAGDYAKWRENMGNLYRLFDSSNKQIEVVEHVSATDIRRAYCEAVAAIDPMLLGNYFGAFRVELTINDSFWESVSEYVYTSGTGSAGVNKTHVLPQLAPSTAPMEDLILQVVGPATNPKFTDLATGHVLELQGVVNGGSSWWVNTSTWETVKGSANWGSPSVTESTRSVGVFAPRLFGITPNPDGPEVLFSCTSPTSSTQIAITSRRKFL